MLAYAICSSIGLIVGGLLAYKIQMPRPPQAVRLPIYVCAFIGAIVGAKVPIWLSYGWYGYILQGKSVMGGILGAFLAINLYKKCSGHTGGFGGRFVIPLAVTIGFGKIGCYLNGCCGGTLAFPVQLLESIFQFVMAGCLYLFYRRTQRADLLFPVYLLSYLVMRFIIEFWRTEPRVWLQLSVYQWLAVAFIPVCILIIWRRAHDNVDTAS
ncbi:prolipoprotein diacylglyceryl transferase [Candidatus Avelusimicrobium luingense]|uniref:prolipoprotein diacylglyceryl transferase n=1 Tax=Candidatus Avelusimicrobium luingense TaxID=3416211 RepID=UPI003D0FA0EF